MTKEVQNKFDLPPSVFSLVCERAKDPERARDVYEVLLDEMHIQLDWARDNPDDAAFLMIAMYALLLNEFASVVEDARTVK